MGSGGGTQNREKAAYLADNWAGRKKRKVRREARILGKVIPVETGPKKGGVPRERKQEKSEGNVNGGGKRKIL